MSYRSQRFSFAILVGIVLNLAFTFFIQIACWGPMISVIVAAYLTRLTNPKEGTVIGAIVFLPSSVVLVIQTITRTDTVGEIGLLLTILAGFIGVGFGVGLGGLFGFLVGKIFDFQRTMS
jgi:hypothetical protein